MSERRPRDGKRRARLVPRMTDQGYARRQVAKRRQWVAERTGAKLDLVGASAIPTEQMRGNIENPVGAAQVPLGIAGPLRVRGEHAEGDFYVPLATTEGALVRSYERGMVALTEAGGATVRVDVDRNRVSPIFAFDGVAAAHEFCVWLPTQLVALRAEAAATTRHGKLMALACHPLGREVIVDLSYETGDAQGMNMIVKASDRACRWIVEHSAALGFQIFSGYTAEKRAAGVLLAGGKGKRVTAGAELPRRVVASYLNTTPEAMATTWRKTVLGHLLAGSLGYNGHYANGLTALFIACGQDVANVANSAVGITTLEATDQGSLFASVALPSLSVATVGGGTALGTVASGEFVEAHETYGRNPPAGDP